MTFQWKKLHILLGHFFKLHFYHIWRLYIWNSGTKRLHILYIIYMYFYLWTNGTWSSFFFFMYHHDWLKLHFKSMTPHWRTFQPAAPYLCRKISVQRFRRKKRERTVCILAQCLKCHIAWKMSTEWVSLTKFIYVYHVIYLIVWFDINSFILQL